MKNTLSKTLTALILTAVMLFCAVMPSAGASTGSSSGARVSGDLNGDGSVDIADVVLLLQHTLFPDLYPVNYPGSLDFSDDGTEDMADVVMLLQHILFPSIYDIKPIDDRYIYKHVVILGVDGAGAFFREAATPNIDRIFANGSVTYEAQCMKPSISGQNWGSILHGVLPEFHGCTNSSHGPYPSDSPYPSIFRVVRESDPNAELASFNNWSVINSTEIEDELDVHMDNGNDDEETDKIVAYLEKHQPRLMFVQFDSVDAAGHSFGNASRKYLEQINHVDGLIGRIYDKMVDTGMMEDTLIIVTADHGHTQSGGHGGDSKAEMTIMMAAAGKTVVNGVMGDAENRDIAAIALYALGLEKPSTYTAKIPGNLFPEVEATPRQEYMPPAVVRYENQGQDTPEPDSGDSLFDFISIDDIAMYMPLDGDVTDLIGDYTSSKKDKIYFVDGYFGQAAGVEDGAILTDFAPGLNSFSISCWVRLNTTNSDPCIFSNKDWDYGVNPGFVLSYRKTDSGFDIKFNLGDGTKRMDVEGLGMPSDYLNGWMPVIFVVDRNAGTVGVSLDFGPLDTSRIELGSVSFNGIGGVNFGQDGTGSYKAHLPAVIDEIIIFNKALTSAEIAALKQYYKAERVE
ncbi:MAG: alkaline phosphatase family protein [Clostridia bacterium]|nr:alkaline phosphatase family protein [Clostridia bacterium]